MFSLVVLNQISLQDFCVGYRNRAIPEVSDSGNLGKELMDGHRWLRNTVLGSHKIPLTINSFHRNNDQYFKRRPGEINSVIGNRKIIAFT